MCMSQSAQKKDFFAIFCLVLGALIGGIATASGLLLLNIVR